MSTPFDIVVHKQAEVRAFVIDCKGTVAIERDLEIWESIPGSTSVVIEIPKHYVPLLIDRLHELLQDFGDGH